MLPGVGRNGRADETGQEAFGHASLEARWMAGNKTFGVQGSAASAVGEVGGGGAPVVGVDLDPDVVDVRPDRHLAAGTGRVVGAEFVRDQRPGVREARDDEEPANRARTVEA